jgi:hypothetical protein
VIPHSSISSDNSGPHLHFHGTVCPVCEQEIPPDKLEEIGGRIAARELDRERSIKDTLSKQFAFERSEYEAKAAAALDQERQQAAARTELAREEAQKSAQATSEQQIIAIRRSHEEQHSVLKERMESAEAARIMAEQTGASLMLKLQDLQRDTAAQLEAAALAFKAREEEIRATAVQDAERLVAEASASKQAAFEVTVDELRRDISTSDQSRKAAEQRSVDLQARLAEVAKTKDAEIERVRTAALEKEARVRQEATQAAEARAAAQLSEKDKAIAEAQTNATAAQALAAGMAEQHEAILKERLDAQRSALEKDRDDVLGKERAKSFEETQKLVVKVNDLQRDLDRKTNEELGEGAEINLFEALKVQFPDDDIQRVAKGAPGADVIQVVMLNRRPCGTIIYDSKNHKAFRSEHVAKLRTDQLAQKAEHAILSSHKLPAGCRQVHIHDGIIIANPARVAMLALLVRQHIIQVHTLRVSSAERENKTIALYDFMTSDRFAQHTARVDAQAEALLKLQEKEVAWHKTHWIKEGELTRSIQKANGDLISEVTVIIGTGLVAEDDEHKQNAHMESGQ